MKVRIIRSVLILAYIGIGMTGHFGNVGIGGNAAQTNNVGLTQNAK